MRLKATAEEAAFRSDACHFIADNWAGLEQQDDAAAIDFRRRAIEHGFIGRSYPRHCGGRGEPWQPALELIWREECRKSGAPATPAGTGVQMLVPTLLEVGTRAQQERFIGPALTGTEIWSQGFSEPNAGSDLASLRTKARLDGDSWIVDGQKIWTTHAERADWLFALVRTEPELPRHKGISFLLIDMRSPGITVRPIRQMTGEHEYCEVFLDSVRIPAENIVGTRGDGWKIANLLLKHERGWIGDFIEDRLTRLVELARTRLQEGRSLIGEAELADRLGEIEGHVLAHKASSLRRLTATARGEPPALIDHVAKLYATGVMERISRLVQDLLGPDLLGRSDDPWGDGVETANGYWVRDWYWSMAYAIAGGSSNVQRDVIALRGLGLARAGG